MTSIDENLAALLQHAIITVRDASPRIPNDADSDDIVDAIQPAIAAAIEAAERRGAVRALRMYANVVEGAPLLPGDREAKDMRALADGIESGEMAL